MRHFPLSCECPKHHQKLPTGAGAAGLHHSHSNARSEPQLRPTPQLMATGRILNPLSEARDRTHVLMDTGQIHFCCATMGTPPEVHLKPLLISPSLTLLVRASHRAETPSVSQEEHSTHHGKFAKVQRYSILLTEGGKGWEQ